MKPPSPSARKKSISSPRRRQPATGGERLQKVLASAGIASRRQCETLILEGRVEVDRKLVTRLGTRVDPACQEIRIDGTPLRQPRRRYFLINKPVGVVSTNRDPQGRARVIDLVPCDERLFTVGRLDRSSEGLILVTNDGELANRLTHPRYEIAKTYRVRVAGQPSAQQLQSLRQGVHLAEGVARVASLHVKARQSNTTDLEMVLTEGRNREIRRVLARIGHKVLQLRRTAMGPLRLGQMAPGEWRELSGSEVRALRRFSSDSSPTPKKRAGQGRGRSSAVDGQRANRKQPSRAARSSNSATTGRTRSVQGGRPRAKPPVRGRAATSAKPSRTRKRR